MVSWLIGNRISTVSERNGQMKNYRTPRPGHPAAGGPRIDHGGIAPTTSPAPGAPAIGQHIDSEADLGMLFQGHLNPEQGLSDAHYLQAASALNVEVAAIQAVAEVETSGHAFDNQGRPTILFERHYFHRLTQGAFDATHGSISQASAGGYGKFSEQYGKLEEAWHLAPDAALRSASWGRFQIMGDNFRAAGFDSASAMVLAHTRAEFEHLKAFVHFVLSNKGMPPALRAKDWNTFARAYNGKGYKANDYDGKMQRAYERIKAAAPQFPPGQH
jgi:hypothetical protein